MAAAGVLPRNRCWAELASHETNTRCQEWDVNHRIPSPTAQRGRRRSRRSRGAERTCRTPATSMPTFGHGCRRRSCRSLKTVIGRRSQAFHNRVPSHRFRPGCRFGSIFIYPTRHPATDPRPIGWRPVSSARHSTREAIVCAWPPRYTSRRRWSIRVVSPDRQAG